MLSPRMLAGNTHTGSSQRLLAPSRAHTSSGALTLALPFRGLVPLVAVTLVLSALLMLLVAARGTADRPAPSTQAASNPAYNGPSSVVRGPSSPTTSTITVRGHILLQGRPTSNSPLISVLVTGTLSTNGVCLEYATITDNNGYFTITETLPPGDYEWRIKDSQTLARSGNATLADGLNSVEMGTLRGGDTDNNNTVGAIDFAPLRRSFGKTFGDPIFDGRTDFDGNGVVNATDFSILRSNFGQAGVDAICTPPPPPTLPPDPTAVATPVDNTIATDLGTASEFLYTGDNAIQTGVISGTIEMTRVTVLRGKVLTRQGAPLSGVTIEIKDHPEFGQTLSRDDGEFDMAVNGGGLLNVTYSKEGYLPAEREIHPKWADYEMVPEVAMIPLDPSVTVINTLSNAPIQVARGSVVSDTEGMRQSTLLFPAGTSATITLPNGITRTLTVMHVRSTEYTVGDSGPEAMPGDLPDNSGYTYAPEFSVDEAMAVEAKTVTFNQPVISYNENFLDFPTGSAVPMGYYDRERGEWVASNNGLVVEVLSITGGMVDLDVDGSGTPATSEELAALGITNAERTTLATLYTVGQTLWRVPVLHFTPWDCNWPYGPPDDATGPDGDPEEDPDEDCNDKKSGSVIGCQNQTLGEAISIAGTNYRLHYQSDRVPGRTTGNNLKIPLSGGSMPASARRIEMNISVAGQTIAQSFSPSPNQQFNFTWDGRDAYGRIMQGCQPITVRTSYIYGAVYLAPGAFQAAFGRYSGTGLAVGGNRAASEVNISKSWQGCIGGQKAPPQVFGGWGLNIHHVYDTVGRILYLGTGEKRSAEAVGQVIGTAAGTGAAGFGGDGGPATQAQLRNPTDVVVAPDGTRYVADYQNHRIRKIDANGTITTIAGTGTPGYNGDGIPATQARLFSPYGIAAGPDGSLYIADTDNNRVRKVDPNGIISTVAGTGVAGFGGDGGDAASAQLWSPSGVALGPDGSIYIADTDNDRVRHIATDGVIATIAGTGVPGYNGDGIPAATAQLFYPIRVAAGQDGSVFISDLVNQRVRKIGTNGTISTVAGTGTPGFTGDGGDATAARLNNPIGLSVGTDGSVFIADSVNGRIRQVNPDGIIGTLAGNGSSTFSGDSGLATGAGIGGPAGVARTQDGSLFVAESYSSRMRQVGASMSGLATGEILIPSDNGSMVYVFSGAGRHLRTLNGLTGGTVHQFSYDSANRLIAVADGDNNVTIIERDGTGKPTAIVAPDGQRTTLTLNPNGYLSSVTNPANETIDLGYGNGGLLTSLTDPRDNTHTYTYDTQGRLILDESPDGSYTTLNRTAGTNVYTVTVTTAMSRTTVYRMEKLTGGGQRRVVIDPNGLRTENLITNDGRRTAIYPDGTVTSMTLGPDPRWGMQAPVLQAMTQTLPGGLTQVVTGGRAARLANPGDPLSLQAMTDTLTVNGRTFTSVYNAGTRVVNNITAAGKQASTTLDVQGRAVAEQVAGLDPATYTFDSRGRLSSTVLGTGLNARGSSIGYGSDGFPQTITDSVGSVLAFGYDAVGRVLTQTLPQGRTVNYSYDGNGNVTSFKPPGRPLHTTTYTTGDLEEDYTAPDVDPNPDLTHHNYNLDRQTTQASLPGGAQINSGYDTGGRVNSVSYQAPGLSFKSKVEGRKSQAAGSETITFGYDPANGNMTSITGPGGVAMSHTYIGRLPGGTTWSGPVTGSIGRTYDNSFRLLTESVNGGNTVTYGYDLDGLISQAGVMTLTRHPLNGLLTGSNLGSLTDTLLYNSFGEASDYQVRYAGSSLYSVQYGRDKRGRIVDKTETIGGATQTYSYTYDLASRLASVSVGGVQTSEYGYDQNGNRLAYTSTLGTVSGTYDNQDRLLIYGTNTYTYTPNGDLLSKTNTSNGQTTAYTYDPLGNLTVVTLPTGTRIDYVIDGNSRRIGKRVNGTLTQGFLYKDTLKPIAELDGSSNLVSRFVYVSQGNVPDYMVKSGVTYRIVSDNLGSPRLVVNTATGAVVQRMDYNEFGRVITDTNPGFQPFGFAGGLYDTDTGLVRFGARDYDAEVGRWTAKDPLRFNGGDTNLYVYVGNDPVNFVDPSGLFLSDLIDIAFFGWSLKNFIDCPGWGTGFDLFLDTISLLPIIPSIGYVTKADDLYDAVRTGDNLVDAAKPVRPPIKPGTSGGPTAGKPFPESVKDAARAENPSATCVYCGREGTATQVDHAVPKSRGGDATIDNAQMACPHCNASKGARDYPVTPPAGYEGPWPPPWWPR